MSLSEVAISALLPVKNGQDFLESLLPDILAMLAESDELIVINDGSSDQSQHIIEKYSLVDSRMLLINTPGIGLVPALNLGVEISKNTWIARFDVDDRYSQNRIEEQRKYLSEDVSVVFSDYQFVSRKGRRLGSIYSALTPIATALSLVSSQRTAHPSAIINRKLLIDSGGYQVQDFPAEDLALWLRMSHVGEIISVPIPLLSYTLSGKSISAQNRRIQKIKKQTLIESHSSWFFLQARSIEDFEKTLLKYARESNYAERTLLHLRDLYLVSKLTGMKVPVFGLLQKIGLLMFPRLLYTSVKMLAVVSIRRLFRFIY
jgi:glycosyltransferase involved in cell wall biosynthesis